MSWKTRKRGTARQRGKRFRLYPPRSSVKPHRLLSENAYRNRVEQYEREKREFFNRITSMKPGDVIYLSRGRLPKVERRGNSIRVRLREPSQYTDYRTHDVGRAGKTQRIVGYHPRRGWETQAWRFAVDDLRSNPKTQRLFLRVVKG